MTIREYTIGSSVKSDRDLFAWVGHFLINQEIHDLLGLAITSIAGDRWLVLTPEKGPARGFCLTRDTQAGAKRHIRYIYGDTALVRQALLARVIDTAKADQIKWLWTRERKTDGDLPKAGFVSVESDETGRKSNFCRWDMKFGEQK